MKNRRWRLGKPGLTALCVMCAALVLGAVGMALLQPSIAKAGPPYVVALDAGHGGKDVGAIGVIEEVELTERTTQKLLALLQSDANFSPVLCRELESGAGVNERARYAKSQGAVLLLSIHGNADDTSQTKGFECYPAPPGRKTHEDSLRFAQLVAAQMQGAGHTLRGEGGVRYLYYENSDTKVIKEQSDSSQYQMQTFGVLEVAGCPAVLAEQCFVTNAADVEAFGGEAGCEVAARCYYNAIKQYFEVA